MKPTPTQSTTLRTAALFKSFTCYFNIALLNLKERSKQQYSVHHSNLNNLRLSGSFVVFNCTPSSCQRRKRGVCGRMCRTLFFNLANIRSTKTDLKIIWKWLTFFWTPEDILYNFWFQSFYIYNILWWWLIFRIKWNITEFWIIYKYRIQFIYPTVLAVRNKNNALAFLLYKNSMS